MDAPAFDADFDKETGVLAVSGDVDEMGSLALREAIDIYSDGHTRDVVIDLTDVAFLPSVAVGVLATSLKKSESAGGELELLVRGECIAQRVLNICGLPYRDERN